MQPADLALSNEEAKKEKLETDQNKAMAKTEEHHEEVAKQQNLQMRRHKRQISLSEMPDENQKDLEPEVSITPNMRNANSKHHGTGNLFVTDAKPQREPPLTSKQKTTSIRQ